ncbi:MAG: ATP cone domain-containing protein [bacterium]|nr:ATP cone domain-containing protein [bacterium]
MAQQTSTMIVKASGDYAPLDIRKLERSVRHVGASKSLARGVAQDVARDVRDGMTTRQIHALVLRALRQRRERSTEVRYSLKEAMRRLGPAGYDFEHYVAAVLRAHGYDAYLPPLMPGMAVEHEVDVIARKGSMTAMVEAKYRNAPGIYVRLKDIMATWARYEDLREAYRHGKHTTKLTACWVVCNTKVTGDGIAFGEYKGMRIIGWEYPKGAGLQQLVIEKHLYPVTVLRSVSTVMRTAFANAGLIVCHDIAGMPTRELMTRTGLSQQAIDRVQREVAATLPC